MCGRFVSRRDPDELVPLFDIERIVLDRPLGPDYNVAPTKEVYAVLDRARDGETQRQLRAVRWGLVPSWAKDPTIGRKLVNARLETAAEKPSFRGAFAKRRAILPADGYYEWHDKRPYFIHPADGEVMALAGLYEYWRDAEAPKDDPDSWMWTAVVLTTEATENLGHIHDRSPLVVPPENYDAWLDPEFDEADEVRSLLLPATLDSVAEEVSTEVNNVRNNGEHLITPVS